MADQINIALNQLLSNNFVSSAVTLGLSFYAYKAGPELPSFMEELFENVFFQIFVGFMVLYMNTQNVMLSLVVSVVFVYGMKMFAGIKEGMFGGTRDNITDLIKEFKTVNVNVKDIDKSKELQKKFNERLGNRMSQINTNRETMLNQHKSFIIDLNKKICNTAYEASSLI